MDVTDNGTLALPVGTVVTSTPTVQVEYVVIVNQDDIAMLPHFIYKKLASPQLYKMAPWKNLAQSIRPFLT
jgi:hypothetical protein